MKMGESMGGGILGSVNEMIQDEIKNTREDLGGKDKKTGKGASENPEKDTDHAGKIDEIFDELLDKVKNAPEAQQEALKILIQQMRQIGEQLKHVRDMKHLHEMKKMMVQHWNELIEIAKGDPEMLKQIQDWGKKFVEEKIVFYDLIGEIKDELIDKSQDVEEGWSDIQMNIGKAAGIIDSVHLHDAGIAVDRWLRRLKIDLQNERISRITGLEDFIESIGKGTTGFDDADLDLRSANEFLSSLNGLIRELYKLAYQSSDKPVGPGGKWVPVTPIEKNPELEGILNGMIETAKKISKNIKECSKIYKTAKKIRDTHFLDLYNEQAPSIAA